MSVKLTIATSDYDHFRDFRLGHVRAEGIEATWLTLGHHEIFSRFTFNREWDVSELSFAKFAAQVTRENSDIIGLPVYASRLFRFSSVYVNHTKGIKKPEDLRGKRIGVPEWAHTAAVYMRGWLAHDAGVALSDIDWVQAGTNEAGRIEKVELSLPQGRQAHAAPDKTLSAMIASGELDAVIIARPPNSFREKHPDVVRLFPDYEAMEQRYYEQTRVYPIMHVIALRKGDPRRPALGGAQSAQCLRGVQTPQPGAHPRSGGVALSGAVADQLRQAHAGDVRRRAVSLRHRGQPGDVGTVFALRARAGHRAQAGQAGGHFPGRHHGVGEDLDPSS